MKYSSLIEITNLTYFLLIVTEFRHGLKIFKSLLNYEN